MVAEVALALVVAVAAGLLTEALDMSQEESDAFWPIYREFETKLSELGDRFVEEEKARMASYDENTFALRKLIDESALREFVFENPARMLTDANPRYFDGTILEGELPG